VPPIAQTASLPLCSSCERHHSPAARFCPHCGRKILKQEEDQDVISGVEDGQAFEERLRSEEPSVEDMPIKELEKKLQETDAQSDHIHIVADVEQEHLRQDKIIRTNTKLKRWGVLAFAAILTLAMVLFIRSWDGESFELGTGAQPPGLSPSSILLLSATYTETPFYSKTPSNTSTSVPPPLATPMAILFQDDFSDPYSGWDQVDVPEGITDYENGYYRMYVNTTETDIWANPGLHFTDVIVEVDAAKGGGPDDNDFGVICRYQDVSNFYFFIISSDGFYGIGKVVDGEQNLIGADQMYPHEVIKQGNTTNHIKVDCVDSHLVLYANGAKLVEVEDSTFSSGDVGLIAGTFAEAGTDIHFDNFVIYNPHLFSGNSIAIGTDDAVSPTLTITPPRNQPLGKIVFTCQMFKDTQRNQICMINANGSGWVRLTENDDVNHIYPSLSPDGSALVYSANPNGNYQIYEMDLQGDKIPRTNLAGDSYAPAISPNGRLIVFTYDDGAHQAIWLMNRDGSNPHLLTRGNGDAWDAAWSTSSNSILFASGSYNAAQLFVIDVDGSNMRRITNVSNLRGRSDWSPDGVTVATYIGTSWNRELFLLGTDGSNMRQITSGGNNLAPSFSPDGHWIAFTSYMDSYKDENGCEIYIMRINDGEIIRLTENDYCDWQPRWGP